MKPGIYPEMSEMAYRSAAGVNQSLLKTGAKSWKKAHYEMSHARKPTPAMILGTRQHTAMLQPDMMEQWVVKPEGMSFATKEGKEWRASMTGRDIITFDEMEAVKGMSESIWNNPDAAAILKIPSHKECSAFAQDEDAGLLLKARFDILPKSESFIVDIKKVASARAFDWEKQCAYLGYHIQAAFYGDIRARITGTPTSAFIFIVVEDEAPYESVVYQMGDKSIEKGRLEYTRLLSEYKQCLETDTWPGYFSGVRQFDVPIWCLMDKPVQDQLTYQLT